MSGDIEMTSRSLRPIDTSSASEIQAAQSDKELQDIQERLTKPMTPMETSAPVDHIAIAESMRSKGIKLERFGVLAAKFLKIAVPLALFIILCAVPGLNVLVALTAVGTVGVVAFHVAKKLALQGIEMQRLALHEHLKDPSINLDEFGDKYLDLDVLLETDRFDAIDDRYADKKEEVTEDIEKFEKTLFMPLINYVRNKLGMDPLQAD